MRACRQAAVGARVGACTRACLSASSLACAQAVSLEELLVYHSHMLETIDVQMDKLSRGIILFLFIHLAMAYVVMAYVQMDKVSRGIIPLR